MCAHGFTAPPPGLRCHRREPSPSFPEQILNNKKCKSSAYSLLHVKRCLGISKLNLAGENSVSLSVNHLQKLRLSFQLSTPLGHAFNPHQAFLKLTPEEGRLIHVSCFTVFTQISMQFACITSEFGLIFHISHHIVSNNAMFAVAELLLAVGCWLLAVGCWLLAVGCLLLVVAVAYWLLAVAQAQLLLAAAC